MHYAVAKQLAAKGRNGDSMLMHMHPEEVKGLAALGHLIGRPLTTNPHTGLPEAFRLADLGRLLPILGGIGGGMLGGPAGAALGAGAGEAIDSAAIHHEKPMAALAKSLGAGALAGIGGAMFGGGAGTAADTAAASATSAAPESFMSGLFGSSAPAAGGDVAANLAKNSAFESFMPSIGSAATNTAAGSSGTLANLAKSAAFDSFMPALSSSATEAAASSVAPEIAGNMFTDLLKNRTFQEMATSIGVPALLNILQNNPEYSTNSQLNDSMEADYGVGAAKMRGMGYNIPPTYNAPGYAGGGVMGNPMPPDFYPQSMIATAQPKPGSTPIHYDPLTSQQYGAPVGQGYASGGVTPHGSEGLLRGPGDGQSDGIAAVIHGKQGTEPVRLADNEYVVPADVVAALGAGSSAAGAKAMDAMLARVRKAAYGHTQQMRPVNHSKVMPA